MEFILEFLGELLLTIIAEFVFGYILTPFYLLIFFTGAFLIWLYHRKKLAFAHFVDKKDEDKVLHNYQAGCAFYFFVFMLWVVFCF